MNGGVFTFSLDFELGWGNLAWSRGPYRQNLIGARELIPQLLDLSAEYGVRLTWATIGLLFYRDRADALDDLSAKNGSQGLAKWQSVLAQTGTDERLYFAADLIQRIILYDGHEMASHTFSHFSCKSASAADIDAFRDDLALALGVAARHGIEPRSIVFPQNRWTSEHLRVVKEAAFRCYRGNPLAWGKNSHDAASLSCLRRGFRWLDSILELTGHRHFAIDDLDPTIPVNVAATRFLRPSSPRSEVVGSLQARRILQGMTHAANHGEIYHLWCHPHNLGRHVGLQIRLLRQIFQHFQRLRDTLGMRSMTMIEIARYVLARQQKPHLEVV
jgi:peptidoglycan/xylan/chitin deacetylase (PgdA/CDA1 family)